MFLIKKLDFNFYIEKYNNSYNKNYLEFNLVILFFYIYILKIKINKNL